MKKAMIKKHSPMGWRFLSLKSLSSHHDLGSRAVSWTSKDKAQEQSCQ